MPTIPYEPKWKKFEEDMHSDDPVKAREATEKFTQVREEEMRKDSQARRWEESRKKEFARNKPVWARDRQKKETAAIDKFKKELKTVGAFDTGIKPTPGYLIVDLGEKPEDGESKLASGIFLPAERVGSEMQNTGTVLDIGGDVVVNGPHKIKPPCKPGNKILFKKGAGIDLTVNDHVCRFMAFSDVLGTFYES